MNKKRVLTHNYVCFAINGYKEDLLQWINKTVIFFKESGFILKRVLFDRVLNDNSRMYSYSLSRFFEYTNDNIDYKLLYPFIIHYIENAKVATTEHYGCFYNQEEEVLVIYFDETYADDNNLIEFMIKYISIVLQNTQAVSGYFYTQQNEYTYFMGGADNSMNLFKECGLRWWNLYCNKDSIIGKFRHIYKMNLLSMNHLQIKIGDKLFPDWVKENNYGEIIKISPQNWLWTINMAKQPEIAKILYNHQLLVGVD